MGLLNKELVAPFFAASGFHFLGCDFYHKGIDFPGVIWAEADASHARYAKGFVGLFGVVQRNCAYRTGFCAQTTAHALSGGFWLQGNALILTIREIAGHI